MDINLLPLVSGVDLPTVAPAVARSDIPPGYGVQEQCLPFTAATALGFLINSPSPLGFAYRRMGPAGDRRSVCPWTPGAGSHRIAPPDTNGCCKWKVSPVAAFARLP